jgi:hypothetical protein
LAIAGGSCPTPWCFWGNQQWLQNFLYVLAYAVRGENLARCLNAASRACSPRWRSQRSPAGISIVASAWSPARCSSPCR